MKEASGRLKSTIYSGQFEPKGRSKFMEGYTGEKGLQKRKEGHIFLFREWLRIAFLNGGKVWENATNWEVKETK